MSSRSKSEQILRQLVKAARSAPEPRIDFERLQASVRLEWVAGRLQQSWPQLHWRWVGTVAVAVSFFIGGWYGRAHHQKAETPATLRMPSAPTIDGLALLLDQELEAGREPLTVNHPGVARWTLGPGGKAKVVAKGKFLTVQLDAGTIEADVVPSVRVESFAIEAGALRVAVHGTSFSVTKTIDSLEVVVTAGTVVVGPSGAPGQTVGTVLDAPARQRFTASVAPIPQASVVRNEPPEASVSPLHAKSSAVTSATLAPSDRGPVPSAASAEIVVEEHPSAVAIETPFDTVRAAVARCFADAKGSDPFLRRLPRVGACRNPFDDHAFTRGYSSEFAFAPPIPNTIVDCARREVSDFSTSPSKCGPSQSSDHADEVAKSIVRSQARNNSLLLDLGGIVVHDLVGQQ